MRPEADEITEYTALQIACRMSFDAFCAKAFSVLEPGTDYEWSWHIGCMSEHLEACHRGEIPRLIINIPPRSLKSFSVAQAFPAWVMGHSPHQKFIMASYAYSLAEDNVRKCRTIMRSPWYMELFPKTIISADQDQKHHFETTQGGMYYGAGLGGTIIGKGADYIILDDPLNPKEAMSDACRATAISDIRSTLFSRFNDKRTGKFILIMQRLHEGDPTGDLLKDGGYTHVKLPAIAHKPVHISLGDKSWDMQPGQLLFPERLTQLILDQTRLDMTELNFCTPRESPVLMADLSTKMISDIQVGDIVVGFDNPTEQRRRLCESRVIKVSKRKADVVKMTMENGRVVRCTRDHQWFTGRSNRTRASRGRKIYNTVRLGTRLCRVCEPTLKEISSPEELHLAGWLAGFFDGEGSVVKNKNNSGCLISLSQGTGRNLHLCEKFEAALTYFGIQFKYIERERADRKYKKTVDHMQRWYYLVGNSIENQRKLLHVIKVNKWRERLIAGSRISHFVRAEDKIISIEPDGYEEVYGLTTETGNYVVWGYASKNCGQMLQEPIPVGGGEFKEMWLNNYTEGSIKPKEMNIVILVDPAGGDELNKKKKKTSDWTVFDVWGLAPDNNYYLLDRIRDRLNPTERVETLFILHRKWNALAGKSPKVGYEKYGMMTDTHYIREKQKVDAYHFPIIELGGTNRAGGYKEERIRRLIPDMQNGRFYFPATLIYIDQEGRKFDLISEMKGEMASFPRARWDDILDTMSRLYEPELFLQFPKPKATMAGKALHKARAEPPQSWVDF